MTGPPAVNAAGPSWSNHPVNAANDAERAAFLYTTLSDMDPYHATPIDFIHLLVKAAVRDGEIAMDIKYLQQKWAADPNYQAIVEAQKQQAEAAELARRQAAQAALTTRAFAGPPPIPLVNSVPWVPLAHRNGGNNNSNNNKRPGASGNQQQNQGAVPAPPPAPEEPPEEEEDDEPKAPREMPQDFTWILNQAEAELGWTGKYDGLSEIRQESSGWQAAERIGKLLDKMGRKAAVLVKFPNRVHILTIVREILMSVLETQGTRVTAEVRKLAGNYDAPFLSSVARLTDGQRRRLKKLEDGKWMEELLETVELANRQDMFPRIQQAYDMIKNQE